jgi:hypothetical protein
MPNPWKLSIAPNSASPNDVDRELAAEPGDLLLVTDTKGAVIGRFLIAKCGGRVVLEPFGGLGKLRAAR